MTAVVAVAEGGDVVMGIDSAVSSAVLTSSATKQLVKLAVPGHPPLLVGVAGRLLIANEVAWCWRPPAPRDEDAEVFLWECAVSLRAHFTAEPVWTLVRQDDGFMNGEFLLGWRGVVGLVSDVFSLDVSRCGYAAIGSGEALALGALHATADKPAEARVHLALAAAAEHTENVRPPFDVRWAGR